MEVTLDTLFLGPRKRRIRGEIDHGRCLVHCRMCYDVFIYTSLLCTLRIVAVPASKDQHSLFPVLFRVQHIVAFGAKASLRHSVKLLKEKICSTLFFNRQKKSFQSMAVAETIDAVVASENGNYLFLLL